VYRVYDYLSDLHNRLKKTIKSVRATPDRLNELLPLVDQVPVDQKEHFEIEIKVFLRRLQDHHEVWSKILDESKKRKPPMIRRVK
jgi:hypothetical protein